MNNCESMFDLLENEIKGFQDNKCELTHIIYGSVAYTTRILAVLECYAKIYFSIEKDCEIFHYIEKYLGFVVHYWIVLISDWCRTQNLDQNSEIIHKNKVLDSTFFFKYSLLRSFFIFVDM